jgi:RNA methyltransferase, TrmH family
MAYKLSTDQRPRELSFFQSLKGKSGHLAEGIYVVENPKIVRHVLESDAEVLIAYLTQDYFDRLEPLLASHNGPEIQVVIEDQSAMEAIVGYSLHQGVMLAVKIPESVESEPTELPNPHLVLALDSIADAENMGTLIRNAAAFGANALIVDDQSCHPFLRRSVRVSMGTIVDVPIHRTASLPDTLREMKASGTRVLGAALTEHSTPLNEVDLRGNIVLAFGAEGTGLRKEVIQICDELIEIPMAEGVDSLNVSVANGIILNRAVEQRR